MFEFSLFKTKKNLLWVADGVYDRVEHGGCLGGHGRDLNLRIGKKIDIVFLYVGTFMGTNVKLPASSEE